MQTSKIIIDAKDAHMLTGKSPRQCNRMILQAKKHYNKNGKRMLTILEFCLFFRIPYEEVWKAIRNC